MILIGFDDHRKKLFTLLVLLQNKQSRFGHKRFYENAKNMNIFPKSKIKM